MRLDQASGPALLQQRLRLLPHGCWRTVNEPPEPPLLLLPVKPAVRGPTRLREPLLLLPMPQPHVAWSGPRPSCLSWRAPTGTGLALLPLPQPAAGSRQPPVAWSGPRPSCLSWRAPTGTGLALLPLPQPAAGSRQPPTVLLTEVFDAPMQGVPDAVECARCRSDVSRGKVCATCGMLANERAIRARCNTCGSATCPQDSCTHSMGGPPCAECLAKCSEAAGHRAALAVEDEDEEEEAGKGAEDDPRTTPRRRSSLGSHCTPPPRMMR